MAAHGAVPGHTEQGDDKVKLEGRSYEATEAAGGDMDPLAIII
jgi:hypothetical protein